MARRKTGRGAKGERRKSGGRKPRRAPARAVTLEGVLGALERRGRVLMTPAALARALGQGRGAHKTVRGALRKLESEGRVERVRGRFRLRRGGDRVEGIFHQEGHGGVVIDDTGRRFRVGREHDATPGDRVAIEPWGEPRLGRADVLHVVEGGRDHWVGILHRRGRLIFATPYRDDGEWQLRVTHKDAADAEEGEVVVLEPAPQRGGRRSQQSDESPWARVTARLGRPGDPEADVAAVVWRHRLPGDFAPELVREAEALAGEIAEAEIAKRVDLRSLPFVTIDPETARDHDDAVVVEAGAGGGRCLRVAIADVAHYVTPGSRIDREALHRGNSVYFPDRALPMLPPALSSDACSLRAGLDRLALVAELHYDGQGVLLRRSFYPAVIRSRAHLPYDEAAAVMAGERPHPLAEMLRSLDALATQLSQRRSQAGALSLNLPEAAVRFDADGRPLDVVRASQGIAHRAVEEAMLATNVAVANLLAAESLPAVYRNHDPPAPEDLAVLQRVLTRFGLHAARESLDSAAFARALDRTPAELAPVVHPLALRTMRQARYGDESRGHFALACDAYLHFTSPIRRYPDLVVHRVLKALLAGEPVGLERLRAHRTAARCSYRERLAERAERELMLLKKCSFLAGHIGEQLEGRVTGVARHGVYVTLDRWPIEGLVHVSRLPEFVSLDDDGLSLVAEGSRRRYALGDRLEVEIAAVDTIRARIDLEIRRVLEVSPLFSKN